MGENAKLYSTVFALRLNLEMAAYHRQTTFQQRIRLFELVEQLGERFRSMQMWKEADSAVDMEGTLHKKMPRFARVYKMGESMVGWSK